MARLDESKFLSDQIGETRQAMRDSIADMKAAGRSAADIRLWTRQYPWIVTSIAAAAGFIAGRRIVSTEKARRQRWRAARRRAAEKAAVRAVSAMHDSKPTWRHQWKRELSAALRRAVSSLFVAAIASRSGHSGSVANRETTVTQGRSSPE